MFNFLEISASELNRVRGLLLNLPDCKRPVGTLILSSGKKKRNYKLRIREGTKSRTIKLGEEGSDAVAKYKLSMSNYELRRRLTQNLRLLETLVKKYLPYDAASLEDSIHPNFRNNTFTSRRTSEAEDKDISFGFPNHNPYNFTTTHIAIDGTPVRSKSELLIYNSLLAYRVPFKYELLLIITDHSIGISPRYPDFTIATKDGLLYWEHLGLIEDEAYAETVVKKLKEYATMNIYPGKNLILTAESNDSGFDSLAIDFVIRQQILPFI